MTGKRIRTRWSGRSERIFHEVAEAIGVDTDHIMGAYPAEGVITVIYTPELADVERAHIWAAVLELDGDGVPRVIRKRDTGRTFDDMVKFMEQQGE